MPNFKEWSEERERRLKRNVSKSTSIYKSRKKLAIAAHKLYTVKQKKGDYDCCQSMHSIQECSMGPSASETKTAQSVALSPQCYHIRTSLAGKFLIYAVIFFPPLPLAIARTDTALISRCRFCVCAHKHNNRRSVPPFSPPGALPRDRQQ